MGCTDAAGFVLQFQHAINVHIPLRKWNTDPFGVKPFFDLAREIPVDGPIILGLDPRATEQIDGRIGQFIDVPAVQTVTAWLAPGQFLHSVFFVALIIFFSYFYTAIQFNPTDVAENMKMTPDNDHLMLCIVGFGVWKVDISQLLVQDEGG